MWPGFDGPNVYTRDEFTNHIAALHWTGWRPQGITLHNTAAPNLKQWAESGPNHDARIANLLAYYEQMGWQHGPHWFISRTKINGFSDPLEHGTHSRCFNATHFGIEMVGDYNAEPFDVGDGALVRDNAVFVIATLCRKFGFDPQQLTFHVDCKIDNHDCPGHNVSKPDMIQRVQSALGVAKVAYVAPAVLHDAKWIQARLNALGASPQLTVDGDLGPASVKAIANFIDARTGELPA